jgi:hypothetical protein
MINDLGLEFKVSCPAPNLTQNSHIRIKTIMAVWRYNKYGKTAEACADAI